MSEKLSLIAEKVTKLIELLDTVKERNSVLETENAALKKEVKKLQNELFSIKSHDVDNSQLVRSKLTGILERLDELEHIGQ